MPLPPPLGLLRRRSSSLQHNRHSPRASLVIRVPVQRPDDVAAFRRDFLRPEVGLNRRGIVEVDELGAVAAHARGAGDGTVRADDGDLVEEVVDGVDPEVTRGRAVYEGSWHRRHIGGGHGGDVPGDGFQRR